MNRVHALLRGLGVSCLELDRLVDAAMRAGALGAKLCGAGGGGFMIALAPSRDCAERIATALNRAGGRDTFACTTRATG
jgi:mevalonate kinase